MKRKQSVNDNPALHKNLFWEKEEQEHPGLWQSGLEAWGGERIPDSSLYVEATTCPNVFLFQQGLYLYNDAQRIFVF